jgi:PHS family inorganic phosphate transporter-like MFS transporter
VSIVLLAIFHKGIKVNGNYGQFDAVWRLLVGVILVPCIITLYQRLTMPESAKMKGVQALRDDPTLLQKGTVSGLRHNVGEKFDPNEPEYVNGANSDAKLDAYKQRDHAKAALLGAGVSATTAQGKAQAWKDCREYFSEWRHLRVLIGTAMTWFLVDIVSFT